MRRPYIFAIGLFITLLFFYLPFLSGQTSFYSEDTCNSYEPLETYAGHLIAQGHIPLWNPFSYCGMPQIAVGNPSLFYLPDLVFSFTGFSQALACIQILSHMVCAVGVYLLIKEIGWGRLPALACAVITACSGYMFSFVTNHTLVASASWVPLCLWTAMRIGAAVGTRAVWLTLALAVEVALMITAGRPEITVGGLLLIIGYALYKQRLERSPRFGLQIKGIALGILLSMPAVLPLAEWLPLSRRSAGLMPQEVLQFSANWCDLLGLFAAQPLGDLQINAHSFRTLLDAKNLPIYFGSGFVSSIAFALAYLGLQRRGQAVYYGVLALLIVSVTLALGAHAPGLPWLVGHLPVLGALRFPSKLIFFAVFALALFAARGLRNYLTHEANTLPPAIFFFVVALAAAALTASPELILPFVTSTPAGQSVALQGQIAIAWSLFAWSLMASGAMLVLWAAARVGKRDLGAWICFVALTASLLFNAFAFYRIGAGGDFFSKKALVAELLRKLDPGMQATPVTHRYMLLSLEKIAVPESYSPADPLAHAVSLYQYQRQLLKPFANMDYQVASPWGADGPTSGEYQNFLSNAYLKSSQSALGPTVAQRLSDIPFYRLLQATATRYVVTQCYRFAPIGSKDGAPVIGETPVPALDPALFQLMANDRAMNLRLWKLQHALPRAYLSYRWQTLHRDDVIAQMFNADRSAFDPAETTLVEGTIASSAQIPANVPAVSAVAKLTEPQAESLEIEATAEQPAILVLCDQFYPGWSAQVDGQPATILRCNGFLKGIALTAGAHHVHFSYSPNSLWVSCALFLLALLWGITLIIDRRRYAAQAE